MRKLLILGCIFILSGCTGTLPVRPENAVVQQVIAAPGLNGDQIFERSQMWIAQSFHSAKAVLEYENKAEGVLIGNSNVARPTSMIYLGGNDTVSFNMKEEIKDGRARLTFANLTVNSYTSHLGATAELRECEFDAVKEQLIDISKSLEAYLLKPAETNW